MLKIDFISISICIWNILPFWAGLGDSLPALELDNFLIRLAVIGAVATSSYPKLRVSKFNRRFTPWKKIKH